MKKYLLLLLVLLGPQVGRSVAPTPEALKEVRIENRLGAMIPLDLTFKDEGGEEVALGSYFNQGKPIVLILAYYECPNLCTFLLNGATNVFKELEWNIGEQFEVVTVSIDPHETSELARQKKESHAKAYERSPLGGWHFLVGEEEKIRTLANTVGFKYRYDEATKQYAHAAGLFVLTPAGRLARLLTGIQFSSRDMKLALLEAAEGKIGTMVDQLLLFCFRFDPQASRYTLFATRLVKGGALLTVLLLIGLWLKTHRKMRLML